MLLRRLAVAEPFPFELVTHARVTVVCGLDDQRRAAVADVLERVVRGDLRGVSGRFEVDGAPYDLGPGAFGPLQLPDPMPEVRLRRSDLRVAPAPEDLAASARRLATAAATHAAAQAAAASAQARHREVAAMHVQLTSKHNQAHWAARQAAEGLAALDERSAEAKARRADLDAVREPADPGPVAVAADRLVAARAAAAELRARAHAFVARWDEVAAELALLPDPGEALGEAAVAQELAEAEKARADAQATAGSLGFSREDIVALEAAHEAVGQAEHRSRRLVGGAGVRRRIKLARQAEQELLARMGLGSYTELLLMTAVPAFDVDGTRRIDEAQARIDRAHSLAEHGMEPADAERRAALLAERDRLWSDAASLAGTTRDDPEAASRLRALALAGGDAEAAELASALADATGQPAPSDQVALLRAAEDWLAAAEPGWREFTGLPVTEMAGVDEELATLASERAELEAAASRAEEAMRELAGPLEQATADLGAAESAVAEAVQAAHEAEAAHDAAEGDDVAQRALIPAGPRATADAGDAEDPASSVEMHVLGRVSAQRHAGRAGALPLIVDDAFNGLPAGARDRGLSLLARMSDTVQVIYLSDDVVVEEWAGRLGPAASIVRMP